MSGLGLNYIRKA